MSETHVHHDTEQLLSIVDQALAALNPLAHAERLVGNLQQLREQLLERQHMVAVFGAFSTGKSSLINALVQAPALVVSPNPTTAAITHITGTKGTTSARVTAKSKEQLWDDVQQSLFALHLTADNIDDALNRAVSLKPTDFTPASRRYITFLKAVASGYEEMRHRMGTTWDAGAEDLKKYTAEERYACFVQRVDLPIDSPLVQDTGMVLVDTPGVDSIHRRHTDVAFQYMQAADAILFVLYYTHAFSRADKEFLRQLAEVQDIAGTNKLFVVINAVDLAESEEERQAVKERVIKELRLLGVKSPRVYEVSSQLAFAAVTHRDHPNDERFSALLRNKCGISPESEIPTQEILLNSGIPALETDVRQYLAQETSRLAKDAVHRRLTAVAGEVGRQVEKRKLQAMLDEADVAEKRRQAAAFSEVLQQKQQSLEAGTDATFKGINAEWDELIYHVVERIRIRFGQLFKECFHPGRFRIPSQDRQQLLDAATELADVLSRTVEAEMRTFSLRAHKQVVAALTLQREEWRHDLENRGLLHIGLPADLSDRLVPPDLPERVNLDAAQFRPIFRHFSSAKQFFEGGGQSAMQSAAEPIALQAVREVSGRLSEVIRTELNQAWTQLMVESAENLAQNLSEDVNVASDSDDMELWAQAQATMDSLAEHAAVE